MDPGLDYIAKVKYEGGGLAEKAGQATTRRVTLYPTNHAIFKVYHDVPFEESTEYALMESKSYSWERC